MTRAAIYARVSSVGQRERHTIESQLRVLTAFVASQSWGLAGTYIDDGRSAAAGKLDARDDFARLVRDADARRFDVLAVVDVDRLTRTNDLTERAQILGPFQRNGIPIHTPTGGVLDLRTMLGELYVTLQALGAAEWLAKHRERVRQGRITAVQRGRKPSGSPPWGHAYSAATGAWSIDPARGPLLREIFERVAAGESLRRIADDFHLRGVERQNGGSWSASILSKLIRSRAAVGEWTADKQRGLTIAVPAILPEALWQRAQAAVSRSGQRGLRKTRAEYLCEALIACGACGGRFDIRSARSITRKEDARYMCRQRRRPRPGEQRCDAPTLTTADADARAWAAVCRELADPALPAAIAGVVAGRAGDRRDWEADAARWQSKLNRLAAAEREHLGRRTRGLVSAEACDAELARIARERAALTAQIETAGRAATAAGATADRLRDATSIVAEYAGRLADLGFAGRRAILTRLVQPGGIVAVGQELRITLWVPRPPAEVADGAVTALVGTATGRR